VLNKHCKCSARPDIVPSEQERFHFALASKNLLQQGEQWELVQELVQELEY